MDRATRDAFKPLEHRSIAKVRTTADSAELVVPESEGWRLVISAALDEHATPTLVAHWEPGIRRRHPRTALRRLVARHHPPSSHALRRRGCEQKAATR